MSEQVRASRDIRAALGRFVPAVTVVTVLECRLAARHQAGNHAILVDAVEHFETAAASGAPLACYRGRLFGLGAVAA